MLQLTYISTAKMASDACAIEDILAASRRNNTRDRITGLLIYDGRRFLQALEGDADTVERAYARIKLDSRHRAIVKLSERRIDVREFGDWAMAAQAVGPVASCGSIAETVDALVAQVPHASTRALFSSFARVSRQAA